MRYIFDIETTGLASIEKNYASVDEVLINKIVCITVLDVDGTKEPITFTGWDEAKILRDFWKQIENAEELIGFNVDFDLGFLFTNSLVNKVPIALRVKDKFVKITDLRHRINPYNYKATGRLKDFASIIGIKVETSSGSFMPMLYKDGKFDEIKKHCEEDVLVTYKLWQSCKECNLVS